MATSCYGQPEDRPDLDNFAPGDDSVDPGLRAPAPASAASADEPRLAVDQMTLSIEDGLVMVFGPDGDPVPPQAFAGAAAQQPDAVLALADGTAVAARRVAMVLQAQMLGRLGAAERGDAWIMTMLRGRDGPLMASAKDLEAEQASDLPEGEAGLEEKSPDEGSGWAAPDVMTVPALPRLDLDPGSITLTDQSALDLSFLDAGDLEPALDLDDLIDLPEDAVPPDGAEQGDASSVLADLPDSFPPNLANGPETGAGPRTGAEAIPTGRAADDRAGAADDGPGAALMLPQGSPGSADEIDPESIVLVTVRGVPDGARLSAGIRDDDGTWSLSPLDLASVTILPAEEGTPVMGALDGELVITGIALTEDGALAALSERVPLADYLSDPSAGPAAGPGARAGLDPVPDGGADPRPGAIALEIDPRIWDGEEFDALVVRDLPAGASLSAGAHDQAIDGWVLMPQDLNGLTITPPADRTTDFTLTLMGVALRRGDTSAARVLTRLPVALGPCPAHPQPSP